MAGRAPTKISGERSTYVKIDTGDLRAICLVKFTLTNTAFVGAEFTTIETAEIANEEYF
ncbi:hypothetical protein TUM4433_16910 [Shewanella schlegeliana]|nr:hypothetical protein TUM4433_16910 [Shewanella schlegeliana]